MDEFGDNLYNLYGSTEVAWATIATPEDMRAAPGTAGKPPRGTIVKLYDEDAAGPRRRARPAASSWATRCCSRATPAAARKDVIDGLMATGDVGRLDDDGRLFVEGRDDEMIVSGGENVFPAEVEDLLATPPGRRARSPRSASRTRTSASACGRSSCWSGRGDQPRTSSRTT